MNTLITEYISIYSGNRDNFYTDPNYYTIDLLESIGRTFKDVTYVKILNCVIPDINNVRDQPLLVLNIKELDNYTLKGNSNVINNAFSLIYLDVPIKDTFFINSRPNERDGNLISHMKELRKLTIEITDINGNRFDFLNREHFIMFEIKYKDNILNPK